MKHTSAAKSINTSVKKAACCLGTIQGAPLNRQEWERARNKGKRVRTQRRRTSLLFLVQGLCHLGSCMLGRRTMTQPFLNSDALNSCFPSMPVSNRVWWQLGCCACRLLSSCRVYTNSVRAQASRCNFTVLLKHPRLTEKISKQPK